MEGKIKDAELSEHFAAYGTIEPAEKKQKSKPCDLPEDPAEDRTLEEGRKTRKESVSEPRSEPRKIRLGGG